MDQLGPQGFQTNMVVQRPVMESNRARNPTATLSGPPHDPTQMATLVWCPDQSHKFLDGKKTGATLMLCGVLLILVGVIFTALGWQHYLANLTFEGTQLLGPILISVGGTFTFTSICKFGTISCRHWDEEVPVVEQPSTGYSSTSNQAVTLRGATTTLRIPPMYDSANQVVCQAVEFQPGRSVSGILAAVPPYSSVYCVDNAAFTAKEEHSSAHRSRAERTGDEKGGDDDSSSTCSRPPAYEDIYPSLSRNNLT
uniref:transmembrane protein 174 n=1 Tax=Scatophagus argus TaxID=75038 RepID=UPI001ED862C2|nr:transmembrane protein 174 [Scatophagus argus]